MPPFVVVILQGWEMCVHVCLEVCIHVRGHTLIIGCHLFLIELLVLCLLRVPSSRAAMSGTLWYYPIILLLATLCSGTASLLLILRLRRLNGSLAGALMSRHPIGAEVKEITVDLNLSDWARRETPSSSCLSSRPWERLCTQQSRLGCLDNDNESTFTE